MYRATLMQVLGAIVSISEDRDRIERRAGAALNLQRGDDEQRRTDLGVPERDRAVPAQGISRGLSSAEAVSDSATARSKSPSSKLIRPMSCSTS